MLRPDFYRCDMCGNIVWLIRDASSPLFCCGEPMRRLFPDESDGDADKHVPDVTLSPGSVRIRIGSEPHPSGAAHHIEWIALLTDTGLYFREIPAGAAPETVLTGDFGKPAAVYAYCNLHGLWKTKLNTKE